MKNKNQKPYLPSPEESLALRLASPKPTWEQVKAQVERAQQAHLKSKLNPK